MDNINFATEVKPLKYQKQHVERSQKNIKIQKSIPQHHQVVDVVPKPQSTLNWNIPDQTIGIPCVDNLYRQPSSLSKNISFSIRPPIIHHPLISGKITIIFIQLTYIDGES